MGDIKDFEENRYPVKLNAIKNNCATVAAKWFENRDKLEYIIDLYLQNLTSNLVLETDIIKQKIKNFIDGPEIALSLEKKQ